MTSLANPISSSANRISRSPLFFQPLSRKPASFPCSNSKPVRSLSPRVNTDRNHLVTYFPLVKQVAFEIRRNLPAHVEPEDLIGDGMIGLVEAAAKFDSAKQVSFKIYARHRIRGAILDGLRKEDRASRSLRRKIRKMESAGQALAARLGRPATGSEMALELGMSLNQWYKAAAEVQAATLAPAPLPEAGEERHRGLESTAFGDDPFAVCCRNEQRSILASALHCLEEREREMIRLYYLQSQTMKQIGAALGVDESRISQLHSRAIERLRECVQMMLKRREASHASAPLSNQAIPA